MSSPYCREQHVRYVDGNASVFASPGLSAGTFLLSPFARGKEPDVQITIHPWDKYGRVWGTRYASVVTLEVAHNPKPNP